MPDANTIEVNISARTGEYVAAMKEAANVTGVTAVQLKEELDTTSKSAKEAHAPMSAFAKIIKEYRTEVRTEGRYARFLAADISSIGIASKGALGEFAQFTSAIAFATGPWMIGIEAFKFITKTITEVVQEEKKQAEEVKQLTKEISESVSESMKKVRESFEPKKSATDTAWEAEGEKVRKKVKDIQEEINALVKTGPGVKDFVSYLWHGGEQGKGGADTATLPIDNQIKKLQEKQKALIVAYSAKKPEREATQAVEDEHVEEERAKKHNLTLLELQAQMLEGEDQLRLQFEVKKARIREDETKDEQQKNEEIFAEQMVLDAKVAKLKADRRTKEAADEQAFIDQITRNSEADRRKRDAYEEHSAEEMIRVRKELAATQIEEQKKLLHSAESIAKGVGDAFGTAFAGVLAGTQSVAAGIKSMLKATLKAIIDMAMASITASAAKAAAEAAASQAGIPIVGPALAVGAMAAMEATVMALVDMLPSAAGGWDIPTGVNPIVQAHGGEMILPADIAGPLREGLDGEAGGGDHYHVTIHAMDGASVHRVVHSDDFVRAMRDARRTGRMP